MHHAPELTGTLARQAQGFTAITAAGLGDGAVPSPSQTSGGVAGLAITCRVQQLDGCVVATFVPLFELRNALSLSVDWQLLPAVAEGMLAKSTSLWTCC